MKIEWFQKAKIKGTINFKNKLFGPGFYSDINNIQWDVRGIVNNKKNKYVMARQVDNSARYNTFMTESEYDQIEYTWDAYHYNEEVKK